MVEQEPFKLTVEGSSPLRPTNFKKGIKMKRKYIIIGILCYILGVVFSVILMGVAINNSYDTFAETTCKEHEGIFIRKGYSAVVCNDFTVWQYQKGFLKESKVKE